MASKGLAVTADEARERLLELFREIRADGLTVYMTGDNEYGAAISVARWMPRQSTPSDEAIIEDDEINGDLVEGGWRK